VSWPRWLGCWVFRSTPGCAVRALRYWSRRYRCLSFRVIALIGVKSGNVHSSDEQALVDIQKGQSMTWREIKKRQKSRRGRKGITRSPKRIRKDDSTPPVTSRRAWSLKLAHRLLDTPAIQLAIRMHRVAIISSSSSWDTTWTEQWTLVCRGVLKGSVYEVNGAIVQNRQRAKAYRTFEENHVGPDFYRGNCGVFFSRYCIRAWLRKVAVGSRRWVLKRWWA